MISRKLQKYFFEFSQIPSKAVQELMNKKLSRKGGEKSAGYLLLKKLVYYNSREIFQQWDAGKIAKQLCVSVNTLTVLKTTLLKELRGLTFFLSSGKKFEDYEIPDEPVQKVNTLKQLYELGYYREAIEPLHAMKRDLLEVLKNRTSSLSEKRRTYILLMECFDILLLHYYYMRTLDQFKVSFGQLQMIYNSIKRNKNRLKFSAKELLKIEALYEQMLSRKLILRLNTRRKLNSYTFYKEKTCSVFLKLNDYDNYFKCVVTLSILYRNSGQLEKSRDIIEKAIQISQMQKYLNEHDLFNLMKDEVKYFRNEISGMEFFHICKDHYEKLVLGKTNSHIIYSVLWRIYRICQFISLDEELKKYSRELLQLCSLTGRYAQAFERHFWINSDVKKFAILDWSIDDENLLRPHFNKERYEIFVNSFNSYLSSHFTINDMSRLGLIYVYELEIEFWKLQDADFEKAYHIMGKLERLMKKHKTTLSPIWLQFNKVVLKIIDESRYLTAKQVYKKNLKQIKDVLDSMTDPSNKFNIILEYAQLYIIAEFLDLKELRIESKRLYKWIFNNRPELLLTIKEMKHLRRKNS